MKAKKEKNATSAKKAPGTRKRGSIKAQLILTMLALSAIPLIVAIVISGASSVSMSEDDQQSIATEKAKAIQANISTLIHEQAGILKTASSSASVINYLENPEDEALKANMEVTLQNTDANINDGNAIRLCDATGQQVYRTDGGDLISVSERDYCKKALEGVTYVSDVLESKTSNEYIVVLAAPVINSSGQVIGFIHRNYTLNFLDEIVSSFANDLTVINIVDRQASLIKGSTTQVAVGEERPSFANSKVVMSSLAGETGSTISNYSGRKSIVAYTGDATTGWGIIVDIDFDGAMKNGYMALIMIIVIGLVLLVLSTLFVYKIAGSFAKPIAATSGLAGEMAGGNLKAENVEVKINNEIAEMAEAVNDMRSRLSEIITKTKTSASEVDSESVKLSGSAEQASEAANQVSLAVDEIARGSISQADSVQTAVNNTDTIGQGIDAITGNVELLGEHSTVMRDSCNKAMNTLSQLINMSDEVTESVREIGETIDSTNVSAKQISEFTDEISNIADQTNLLSLNASIEAARAGEAGRGFAVVAQEISALAEQSNKSANMIKDIVDKLLLNSGESVAVMAKLNDNFGKQSEQLTSTRDDMEHMAESVSNVEESSKGIASNVESLEAAKNELTNIISDLSAISEENAASTQETNASMEELNATFQIISDSAKNLQRLADELGKNISFFSV